MPKAIEYYDDGRQAFAKIEEDDGNIYYRHRCSDFDRLLFTVDKSSTDINSLYEFIRYIDETVPFDSIPYVYEYESTRGDEMSEVKHGWKHPIRTLNSWIDKGLEDGDEVVSLFGAESVFRTPDPLERTMQYMILIIQIGVMLGLIGMGVFGLTMGIINILN